MTNDQRRLHVYQTGDPYYHTEQPQIRFGGRWLRQAGFLPGQAYTVTVHDDGVITLTTERAPLRSLAPKIHENARRV